ncbi:hypothetical protein HYX08_04960 [Candidatus Woesearchaeota archaeon]|nr:hypothetical protein [Candidatus Woesearchaeota archaeon]
MALLGIENGEIFAGIIGIILLIVFVIWLMRGKGRLAEEKEEEKETDKLKQDEKEAEKAQKDEKKVCKAIKKSLDEIETLAKNIDPDFYLKDVQMGPNLVKVYQLKETINLALDRMISESMSVEIALETFKLLHESINLFLEHVPRGNAEIDRLIKFINDYQKAYYKDLITELEMDRDKKIRLQKLWKDVQNEQSSGGRVGTA